MPLKNRYGSFAQICLSTCDAGFRAVSSGESRAHPAFRDSVMGKKYRVAILIGYRRSLHTEIIRGIARYAREAKNWEYYLSGPDEEFVSSPSTVWDGLIAHPGDPSDEFLQGLHAPVVTVSGHGPVGKLPYVASDDEAIGKLVAEHFLERNFQSFAYLGDSRGEDFSLWRCKGFTQTLNVHGFACHVFEQEDVGRTTIPMRDRLAAWLEALPKPVGLMATSDNRGQCAIQICREIGLNVPEKVAVVGVDNDELVCESSMPPLSSVIQAGEQIGWEAARLLDRRMAGKRSPEKVLVPPQGIFTRRSSDILAIDDPIVSQAVLYIRAHSNQPIQVSDVLENVLVSRRSLERRFLRVLNRTPAQEIRMAHLSRAKELLVGTNIPISEVAQQAGFTQAGHLSTAFREEMGMTPTEFRHRFRRIGG
ncbi:MAG TPA: XylR family transcriptional regulator [Phycisphaerales bacterium]|nr:XylR family transcriptional regulator [Phycisphaerales bacterium]